MKKDQGGWLYLCFNRNAVISLSWPLLSLSRKDHGTHTHALLAHAPCAIPKKKRPNAQQCYQNAAGNSMHSMIDKNKDQQDVFRIGICTC